MYDVGYFIVSLLDIIQEFFLYNSFTVFAFGTILVAFVFVQLGRLLR